MIRPEDFDFLAAMLKTRSGLVLGKDKSYLLDSRLTPLARRRGLRDLTGIVMALRNGRDEGLAKDVVEAMTTNESFFFRDSKPFEDFAQVILPCMMQARAQVKTLRIWCAAASTGQEPYSLAMIIAERAAQLAGWRIDIVGTDLSDEVLDRARAGIYTQFEVQRGLPITLLVKYFKQQGDRWQLDAKIRSMVTYKRWNLLENLSPLGAFDVVFCRNVLIYFDQPTKATVLERMARLMPNDGVLALGAAETVLGITDKFKPMPQQRGMYALNLAPAAPAAAPKPPMAKIA
jgi:chemotaxis protein methyltransferase CheR